MLVSKPEERPFAIKKENRCLNLIKHLQILTVISTTIIWYQHKYGEAKFGLASTDLYSHIFTVYSNHIPLHTKYILYLEWMSAEWETYIFIYLLSLCKWLECTKFLFSLAAVWGDWMELCYILCFFLYPVLGISCLFFIIVDCWISWKVERPLLKRPLVWQIQH